MLGDRPAARRARGLGARARAFAFDARRRGAACAVVLATVVACETEEAASVYGEPWAAPTELPSPRLEAAVAAMGTRLVVLGGFSPVTDGIAITREVAIYDTLADEWDTLPDAPVAWTHAHLGASGGALYLLGGLEGADFVPRSEAYVLPPGEDDWLELEPMPTQHARGAAAIVVAPPRFYVIGGETRQGAVATVHEYNFIRDEWTQLPDLPRARSHPFAMRLPDGTLVVGGGLDGGFALGDVYALRPGETVWELRAPMPTPRGGCAHGVALGWLVCAGGEANGAVLDVVEAYDPIADKWHGQPAMPMPRAGARGAVIGQQLYVVGGAAAPAFVPTSSLFVFSLLNTLPRS